MAGTINLSLSQQFDEHGSPLSGGKLYTIQAGTTATPQSAYQDSDLTLPLPYPITLDAAGRVPPFFLADGQIKIRLTDADGIDQVVADNLLVIGPSSGGGGGGSVDPTTILATGDGKWRYGTGALAGFVRANARTIGSSTSGATERANADTQALFEYLWGVDASLSVSGGRGASANADWSANKTIALPDMRGRVLAGFDDMGNSAAGRLTGTSMNGTGIGAVSTEAQTRTLVTANLPAYTPAGVISVTSLVQNTRAFATTGSSDASTVSQGNTSGAILSNGVPFISSTATFSGTPQGGTSTAFTIVQPTIFSTFYIKL